jgi:hypothetical protein
MDDLMFSYHQAVQTDLQRRGRSAEIRRRALIQRRARRRLAKAQRSALQARLLLSASADPHVLIPE